MLAARDLTNRDIAARLCLSVRTVEVHIDHILTKLGFRARLQQRSWQASSRCSKSTATPTAPKRSVTGSGAQDGASWSSSR